MGWFCSFGTLMTATLDWEGIPAYVISLARGFSAIVGIGATLLYPVVHSWVSTLRTGLWSIWMQVSSSVAHHQLSVNLVAAE
jgi:solute carrier family 40 (iron-regulated transporter), member 1